MITETKNNKKSWPKWPIGGEKKEKGWWERRKDAKRNKLENNEAKKTFKVFTAAAVAEVGADLTGRFIPFLGIRFWHVVMGEMTDREKVQSEEIACLGARVAELEVQNTTWEIKYESLKSSHNHQEELYKIQEERYKYQGEKINVQAERIKQLQDTSEYLKVRYAPKK